MGNIARYTVFMDCHGCIENFNVRRRSRARHPKSQRQLRLPAWLHVHWRAILGCIDDEYYHSKSSRVADI